MKILVVAHEYPPLGGGAGIVAKQFISDLSSTHEIDIVTKKSLNIEEIKGVNIHQVKLIRGLWFFCYLWYFIKNIKLGEYDCIVANDAISLYLCGSLLPKNIIRKTVCLLHGSEPEYVYIDQSFSKRLLLTKYVFERLFLNCKKIFSHSNYMKEKILSCTDFEKLNVAYKVEVSYFGYNDKLFYYSKNKDDFDIKKIHRIESKNKILVSASRIVVKKGYERKLKLFKRLLKLNDNYHWIIIGDGEYKNKLTSLIRESGLESKISLVSKIDQHLLRAYYSQSDLFWLLSDYKESFGLVYIESQACGTPALGPNQFGVKESVDNFNTGLLSNNDEEIINYINLSQYKDCRVEELVRFSGNFRAINFSKRLELEFAK